MARRSTERNADGAGQAAPALIARAPGSIVAAAAMLAALGNVMLGLLFRRDAAGAADLVQVLDWSREWLRGLDPYAAQYASDYPPNALVLLAPLALAPPWLAVSIWTIVHAAAAAAVAAMAWFRSRLNGRLALIFAALVVAMPPFRIPLQLSLASFAAAFAGFLVADRYPRLAGLSIGVSLFKPHIGGPALVWAMAARRWQTVTYALAVPVGLLTVYAVRAARSPLTIASDWLQALARTQNSAGLLAGETNLQPLLTWSTWPPLAIQALVALVLTSGLLLIWVRRNDDDVDFDTRFFAAACLLSLLAVRHLSYDLLLAIPALVFLVASGSRAARALGGVALVVFIASPPSLWRHVLEPRLIETPFDPIAMHAYRIVALCLFLFLVLSAPGRRGHGATI